ncbi:MAG: hypothetical protein CSA70_12030 [Rhodobacterales bacterium]|nr:MAG: hypothetical protein CSA70_12030 [Rhodobacterales bacterium]
MKIALLHPPHPAIGSRVPREHLSPFEPPFGLFCLGGPLMEVSHDVQLVNADIGPMNVNEMIAALWECAPEAILIGHSGSTSVHPVVARLLSALRASFPVGTGRHG